MNCKQVVKELKSLANSRDVAGMAKFGINPAFVLGIRIPSLKAIARRIGKDHGLALELWETGIHEARVLAALIDDPGQVTEEQMESWAMDFDTWDVCDQCCGKLFDKTPFVYKKIDEWTQRDEEFVKRAGFVLMTQLAVHDKKADDKLFIDFFPIIKRESHDDRHMVKKAVNWAIRQIGKRNIRLNKKAVKLAEEVYSMDFKAARWIATDALRELNDEKILKRLMDKEAKLKK